MAGSFKYFLINKSYEDAKAHKTHLEQQHQEAGKALRAITDAAPKTALGLTPDHVKATPEYKLAKATFNAAHDRLRKYNTVFLTQFDKQYKADRSK